MAQNSFNMLLSATLVAAAMVSIGINQPAEAKARRHVAAGRGAYFVPPPPPYAPSILPESQAHVNTIADEQPVKIAEKPPENPYRKYIYTRDAGDMPRVVRNVQHSTNRNVVSYNFRSKT